MLENSAFYDVKVSKDASSASAAEFAEIPAGAACVRSEINV